MSGDTDDLFRLLGASEGITQLRADLARLAKAWALRELTSLETVADLCAADPNLLAAARAHVTAQVHPAVGLLLQTHARHPIGQCQACGQRAPLRHVGDWEPAMACAWGCS